MEKEILSLKDVAEYLGVRTGTVHKFIKGGMPVVRVGRKIIKVRRQDLLDWIASHVVPGIEDH
jgi:excisionase family DNA binding protein